jgi:hypothetical protein
MTKMSKNFRCEFYGRSEANEVVKNCCNLVGPCGQTTSALLCVNLSLSGTICKHEKNQIKKQSTHRPPSEQLSASCDFIICPRFQCGGGGKAVSGITLMVSEVTYNINSI